MKILCYTVEGERDYGFMVGKDEFVPRPFIEEALGEKLPRDVKKFLPDRELKELVDAALEGVGMERVPLSSVHIEPPIPSPRKIICVGLNYIDHVEEAGMTPPDEPIFFLKPPTALTGPFDAIVKPKIVKELDYEGELAAVIAERVRDVEPEEVLQYVFGYTVFNDVSARDHQFRDGLWPGWTMGKSFDTFAPTGPWLTSTDEVGDPNNLRIITRVNGEIRQNSNTSKMIFKVQELVSKVSAIMTLEPGDIIATGTPAGVGFWRKGSGLLSPGDVVEVWIERVGAIRNPVVAREEV